MLLKKVPKKTKEERELDTLTEQEKIYCIQRATEKTQIESLELAFDVSTLDLKQKTNKAYNLERKEHIRDEIKRLTKTVIPAKHMATQAKQLAISDMWTPQEKNEQLKKIAEKLISQCEDESGQVDTKKIDCVIKVMTLSAQLSNQLVHAVKIQSENISYQFLVDRQGTIPTIIDQKD